MVTLSQEAIAKIEQFIANAEPMDWFLVISWRKGSADNLRTSQGAVAWERAPDAGWVAELGGWDRGKVPSDAGTPLHGNVRLLIDERPGAPERFPGGEVYVEGNEFKVRSHAI